MSFDASFFAVAGALTFLFEGGACVARFVFGLRSRDYVHLTLGVRIHHGYVGCVCIVPTLLVPAPWATLVGALAAALVVSDLLHHFVVLPLTIGRMD